MKLSEMMEIINKTIKNGVTEINKSDVEYLFGRDDELLAEELTYLGCEVQRVADLFNVKFTEKFTRKEIAHQKEVERMFELNNFIY